MYKQTIRALSAAMMLTVGLCSIAHADEHFCIAPPPLPAPDPRDKHCEVNAVGTVSDGALAPDIRSIDLSARDDTDRVEFDIQLASFQTARESGNSVGLMEIDLAQHWILDSSDARQLRLSWEHTDRVGANLHFDLFELAAPSSQPTLKWSASSVPAPLPVLITTATCPLETAPNMPEIRVRIRGLTKHQIALQLFAVDSSGDTADLICEASLTYLDNMVWTPQMLRFGVLSSTYSSAPLQFHASWYRPWPGDDE